MCFTCGDADKKNTPGCSGKIVPYLTLSQLVEDLKIQSIKTGKRSFRIFKSVLLRSPAEPTYKDLDLAIEFI